MPSFVLRNPWDQPGVAVQTEWNSAPRGNTEEFKEMKKSLLATVAAVALIAGTSLAGTGVAAAEGAKDQPR
jgi:hypothetical protein